MGAKDQIHIGIALFKLVRNMGLLHHAAAEQKFLLGALRFAALQRAHVAKDAVFGVFTDSTGVEQHQVRLFCLVAEAVAQELCRQHTL